MPPALLTPQLTWTFYGHAALCLCGVAPLFSPESVVPYLVGGCSEKEAAAAGAVLATALQLYAALLVVQSKLLRHAGSCPADLKFHCALAQAQGAAYGLSVGAVIQADCTAHFPPRSLMPLTVIFSLIAARYGGGMQMMKWALEAAPKDPKEKEQGLESEFERGVHTEFFMLFPVPWLTRLFQAYAVLAFLLGATAFGLPEMWMWMLSSGKEGMAKHGCPFTVLRLVVQLYGALTLGQSWLAWKATRFVTLLTRRRITESWAAVFTVSTVVLFMSMKSESSSWACAPLMLIFVTFALLYWATYMEPDVIPGTAAAAVGATGAAVAGKDTDAATEKPASKGKAAKKEKSK